MEIDKTEIIGFDTTQLGQLEWFDYQVDNDLGDALTELKFGFENGVLNFMVIQEDDTIHFGCSPGIGSYSHKKDVKGNIAATLSPLISSRLIWMWKLTNQQGYEDGIQLEFGKKDSLCQAKRIIQMMAIASTLKLYSIDVVAC